MKGSGMKSIRIVMSAAMLLAMSDGAWSQSLMSDAAKTEDAADWYQFQPRNDNGPSAIGMEGWIEAPAGMEASVPSVIISNSKTARETGPWMLEVKKAGRYRITLRQFPKKANKLVIAERAKIEIAGQVKEQPVKADCKGVVFELDLPAGPTELVTYLYDQKGKAGGAYFTEVEAL